MAVLVPAPFGHIRASLGSNRRVVDVHLSRDPADASAGPKAIVEAFQAYLAGETDRPEVPVADVDVTAFQRRVFAELTRVPPGAPITYGQMAEALGKPGAARAVGQALRANPLPLVWPCHRVVASDGLGGFGGCPEGSGEDALEIKRWLLDHEQRTR